MNGELNAGIMHHGPSLYLTCISIFPTHVLSPVTDESIQRLYKDSSSSVAITFLGHPLLEAAFEFRYLSNRQRGMDIFDMATGLFLILPAALYIQVHR